MIGGIFQKRSSNCVRLLVCSSFNSLICLFFLAICVGLGFSLINFVSQPTRFVTILLYNWCKMSNNKIAWIFTWQWSHAKHSCGCNQSLDTLSRYFIRSFCYFSSCDYIDLCVYGCLDFVRFSHSCGGTWQIEHYTFFFIPVIRTYFL